MQFKRPALEPAELNLTPLIDVVFLLLIFFVVSMRFPDQQLHLDLPTSSTAAPPLTQPNVQNLTIYASGKLYLNDQELTNFAQLEEALNQQIQASSQPPALLIQAEGQVVHQQLINVLDLAKRLEIKQVRIATQKISSETQ